SDAYSLVFKLLADAGDEVLVPRPSYPLFEHLTRLDLVTTMVYDLEYHGRASTSLGAALSVPNGRWSIDFDSVERAIGPRTRALLVVSPNNPTGSFVSRDEMDRRVAVRRARRRNRGRRGVRRLRARVGRGGERRPCRGAPRRADVRAGRIVEDGRPAAGEAR